MTAREKIKDTVVDLVAEGNTLLKKFNAKEETSLHFDYQSWYTKSLRVVEWLAKDRYEEFRRYYEPDPRRKSLGYGTYVVQDYLKGVAPGGYGMKDFNCRERATYGVYNQLTILTSVAARASSVLGDIQGSLYAELQDEEIGSAESLLKVNLRAAGALAGVILEAHLQKLAHTYGVKITKKTPTIADLNEPLKVAGVYDLPTWRKVSYLADIRNICSHKKGADPTAGQAKELVDGVRWAVKNLS